MNRISWLLLVTLASLGCNSSTRRPDGRSLETNGSRSQNVENKTGESLEWPNLFGPNRQSQVSLENVADRITSLPQELWRISIGTGYSSPVLQEDRVFVVQRKDDRELVVAYSITGEPLWTHSYPAPYQCPYEYSSGPYSTPVLFRDRIIVVGQAGNTFCLDQETGKVIWSRDLFLDFEMELGEWPVAASGIVVGHHFIFNLGATEKEAGIIALNVDSGETEWTSTRHEAGHATPNLMTIGKKTYVIMVTSTGLVSIDPADGRECWFEPFRRKKAETYNAVSPVVFDNKACMVTGPGPGTLLVEVDPKNRHQVTWKNRRILDSQYTNLLCVDGFLFGFTPVKQGGPELRCIDLVQKELRWKWKAKLGRAMMVACNESILILGEKGHLAGIALSPEGPTELFRSQQPMLDGPCYSAPALYDGKLFLRNEKELVCLQLTAPVETSGRSTPASNRTH